MADALLEHPRAFAEKVARVLGGRTVSRPELTGFVSSDFDPFLNHLFAHGRLARRDAADALEGRPGFVWLDEEDRADDVRVMHGMVANLAGAAVEPPPSDAEITEVRSGAELDAWHAVYREVLGADPRSRADWGRVHDALGPSGDSSLMLLLAWVGGSPAATGAVFFDRNVAGLYCFATRESMRGRGLASALVHASHAAVRARGVRRALLQATPAGRPVYARASYEERRTLPVLRVAAGPKIPRLG
jgi:GNAT superfamily N-acetyltransferase